ncbi:hypothetical protein [Chitinophaga sp. S165]|uniref:glycosyl-4,4'-diaponeurosporenoate acyltransferase CrtO family protein n=1 Tax=Chitinophaga sp. S165 TaxID=2135462 RepID=UPI000D70AFDE|nr:hypothetical protein [Chitinophaga sp. S165]PWV45417.1 hypothetical protein C7475_11480 [Chitinophaga sp. S165]
MPVKERTVTQKAERLAALYNMVPNLFWSLVNLAPAVYYFYLHLPLTWLWIVIPAYLFPSFFPAILLDRLSAGNSRHWYQQLGVHLILEYVQQGRLINRMVRNRYPAYRIVYDKTTIRRKIKETYVFERFHLGLLLAFLPLTGHALWNAHWLWVVVLLLCNFLYNVYPVLLQQYVRLRLRRLLQ